MKKVKVLFVCLGNICRSPLARAIFAAKVIEKGLEKMIETDSCGTADYHIGDNADPRTIANALKNGVSIDHCVRQLSDQDLSDFDFILAMDNSNYRNILSLSSDEMIHGKVRMIRDYDPVGKGEVPDPYYKGEKTFQEVFDILDRSLDVFLDHVVKEFQLTPEV